MKVHTHMANTSPAAAEYLAKWGFEREASSDLERHAEQCARYARMSEDGVARELGLADPEQLAEAMATKPANLSVIEHITQAIPALREHSLRLLAISRGMPYLAPIDDRLVEAGASLAQGVRARLDELSAALVVTAKGTAVIAFSDLGSLLAFSQAGRQERAEDPVRAALEGGEPVLALAPPAEVAKAARHEGSSGPMHVMSSTAQDNFWAPTMAVTESERHLARLLDEAITRRATDIRIAPERDGTSKVQLRVFGDLTVPVRHATLSPAATREITNFLLSKTRASDGSRLRRPADGQMTYKSSAAEVFIRASFIPADRHGQDVDMVSVSLRLLPRTSRSISLSGLNVPSEAIDHIRNALRPSQGLIVLAGPTNSGKSTTIAGVVGEHVSMFGDTKKRLSLEDPVERYLDGITQFTVEGNFAEIIRALLRHDPDMVWVGEIRDAFSAAACVRAATSGHIVMSTVHANNSILAFRAIANYLRKDTGEATGAGASLFDLAESVSLLIGQRLIKRLCPECRQVHHVTDHERTLVSDYLKAEGMASIVGRADEVLKGRVYKANPKGCSKCNGLGYIGELPILEILPATREVRDLFGRSESSLNIKELSKHRVSTLSESALVRVEQGEAELTALFI